MKACALVVLSLFLHILLSTSVFAADNDFIKFPKNEYSLITGYGTTFDGVGKNSHTRVQTFDVIGRYGRFLSDELGNGWYKGKPELLVELPFSLTVDPKVSPMVGVSVLGCWKLTSSKEFVPYIFFGVGVVYVDLDLECMGSEINFVYQGGAGIQYFLGEMIALNLEFRYHHISNAGLAEPNAPINSGKVLVGVSFYR
ncbi:MAG: acyloxyacyl hydrolase [Geobacter sp.]|nr:MAG: acyloxyacyl hydrolase [Geobacter sp.]